MCCGVAWLWNICGDCVQISYISNLRQIQDTAELVKVTGITDQPLWST
jgi:hypothetical protein